MQGMAYYAAGAALHNYQFVDGESLPRMAKSRDYGIKWVNITKFLCLGQILAGICFGLLSSTYFVDYTRQQGLFLAFILIACGVVGLVGLIKRNRQLLTGHLLGLFVTIMLAYTFVGMAGRQLEVDCSLASLLARVNALDHMAAEMSQNSMFSVLMSRINELEDSLASSQEGAVMQLELKQEQEKLKATDRNYIRAKLEMLKRHSEQLLEEVLMHPDVKDGNLKSWSPAQKKALDQRLDAAEQILDRITRHNKEPSEIITFEEYEELLRAITIQFGTPIAPGDTSQKDTTALRQAHKELPNMRAAMTRSEKDDYSNLAVGNVGKQVQARQAQLEEKRKVWLQKYNLETRKSRGWLVKQASALEDMPEHCLEESVGVRIMTPLGVLLFIQQCASAYCIANFVFRLPLKGD